MTLTGATEAYFFLDQSLAQGSLKSLKASITLFLVCSSGAEVCWDASALTITLKT